MNSCRKLVIVGQTPPPYNGQAKMIRQLLDGLAGEFDLVHVRMAYSDSVVSAGKFGWAKIACLFRLIRQTRRVLKNNPGSVLYYPPASPNLVPVLRDILYLLAVRPLAGKTVFHFHAGGLAEFIRRHGWLKPLALAAYGRADAAIELGPSCPRDGAFLGARRVYRVPNGIDVPGAEQPPAQQRPAQRATLHILYVGIHTARKGLFDLLATAEALKQRGVAFEIRTAGLWYDEAERLQFEQRRREAGLEADVVTPGQKTGEELRQLYAWADVFFFPTFYQWETFGLVQLEAMAHSLPVVASDWQGPKDVVADGETGILCPPRNITAFADALQRLANDRALRLQMGRAGRERYRQHFTADCFIRNIRPVFVEVCV